MRTFTRRHHRDRHLDSLASEPLLEGVPRHLMPAVGRAVDVVHLAVGASLGCVPARETFIVTHGLALGVDSRGLSVALVGPGGIVGHRGADAAMTARISALTEVSCFVVARRELPALLEIAPRIADVVARARSGDAAVWVVAADQVTRRRAQGCRTERTSLTG